MDCNSEQDTVVLDRNSDESDCLEDQTRNIECENSSAAFFRFGEQGQYHSEHDAEADLHTKDNQGVRLVVEKVLDVGKGCGHIVAVNISEIEILCSDVRNPSWIIWVDLRHTNINITAQGKPTLLMVVVKIEGGVVAER